MAFERFRTRLWIVSAVVQYLPGKRKNDREVVVGREFPLMILIFTSYVLRMIK